MEKLRALIRARVLEISADFPPDADLYAAGLDSLAIMQLLPLLEEEFRVSIPANAVSRQHFASVNALAGLLRQRLSGEDLVPPCMAGRKAGDGTPRDHSPAAPSVA
jgi:acyl carrier protein